MNLEALVYETNKIIRRKGLVPIWRKHPAIEEINYLSLEGFKSFIEISDSDRAPIKGWIYAQERGREKFKPFGGGPAPSCGCAECVSKHLAERVVLISAEETRVRSGGPNVEDEFFEREEKSPTF